MLYKHIYLIGNGRIADDCLRVFSKNNIEVEYIEVVSEKFAFTEKLCERLNIPFRRYDKRSIRDFLLSLEEKTLIISVHNSYIFPPDVCEKNNLTILNLHIAYLPEYRGMNAPTWAIYNEEQYTGVTWHIVSSEIDCGKIIVQKKIMIGEDDNAIKLMQRCFQEGVRLFEDNLKCFINETYTTYEPQNSKTKLYLKSELPNDGYIDLNWNFKKIYAFLRSMDYSGTSVMRLPRMNHNGKVYEIINYKKSLNEEKNICDEKEIKDNELIIKYKENCLKCTLREIV